MTTYDETTAAALLDAGAVLPPGSTTREDADTLTVRRYSHPALDGRRIVRLVPGTLGEAEDLALDFLGLARDPETPEVGQVRRETLGFPAWALVNDPANGHHALALVKDVERLARQAKSRPGTAKDGFEELGTRLGRAVPHFLPTFYEQAARVFLQHENTTYASAFFGKAREAERVHALKVDEERQRAVFLEFAFAGALTVKALKEHVKALAARLDPAGAWDQFRQLTVERCAAGMPPYASLPQDARALIKAAGLDQVAEECGLVADLLSSPAAVRAPASFWNAYRSTLAILAERQPRCGNGCWRSCRPASGGPSRTTSSGSRCSWSAKRICSSRVRRRPTWTRRTGSAGGPSTASTAATSVAVPRRPSPSWNGWRPGCVTRGVPSTCARAVGTPARIPTCSTCARPRAFR